MKELLKRPLLLCSIGNHGPLYTNTRHNAGHLLLSYYMNAMRMPALESRRDLQGSLTRLDAQSLWLFKSNLDMNLSGNAVSKAFRLFTKTHADGLLCVLHDEMEQSPGSVKMRLRGQARGHNGLRSCIAQLGTPDFARIGVGIGRPVSRASLDVTRHVLGRFTKVELKVLEEETLPAVMEALERLVQTPPTPSSVG